MEEKDKLRYEERAQFPHTTFPQSQPVHPPGSSLNPVFL